MSDEFLKIGSPVKDFVSSFLEQVNERVEEQGFIFCKQGESHAEMELSAVEMKEAGGVLRFIYLMQVGNLKALILKK